MVGRFVQNQQVIRLEHQAGHRQTSPFTTRKHLDLFVDILSAEKESSQNVTQFGADFTNSDAIQCVKNSEISIHQVILILGIVADMDVVSDSYQPCDWLQLTDDQTRKGGFTFTVSAYKGHLLAPLDGECCSGEDLFVSETFGCIFGLDNDLP